MLQQKGETVRASANRTLSLRSRNPSVRVANSIYTGDNTSLTFACDSVSIAAPSDLEFEFDDVIINSQAYRRALAQAHAKSRPPDQQEVGDLINFSDDVTVREANGAPALPHSFLQELQDLVIQEQPVRKQTLEDVLSERPGDAKLEGQMTEAHSVATEPEELNSRSEGDPSGSPKHTALLISRPGAPRPGYSQRTQEPSNLRGPKLCGKCGQKITDQFVRALEDTFHLDCFRCVVCWTFLGHGGPFWATGPLLDTWLTQSPGLQLGCRHQILPCRWETAM